MELTLNDKKYQTGTVTFRMFRQGTEYLKRLQDQTFLGKDYALSELDEAVEFIVSVFGHKFTVDDFYDGFEMVDSTEFMIFFTSVLSNIQMTEEKRRFLEDQANKEKT